MNKWLRLALNSFLGIIMLNLLFGVIFGGVSLAGLFTLVVKLLYVLMIISLVVGLAVAAKKFIMSKE